MRNLIHTATKKNTALVKKILYEKKIMLPRSVGGESALFGGDALIEAMKLFENGLLLEALELTKVLESNFPRIIDIYLLKLQILIQMESFLEAKKLSSLLRKQAPGNLGVLTHTTTLMSKLNGNEKKLVSMLRKALLRFPDDRGLQFNLGLTLEQMGEKDDAIAIYTGLLESSLESGDIKTYESALFQLTGLTPLTKSQLNKLEAQLSLSFLEDKYFSVYFALANNARKMKEIDKEIYWLKRANSMMQSYEAGLGKAWSLDKVNKRKYALQLVFGSSRSILDLKFAEFQNCNPVYIVAMPRSGTTLLEQMLGSHPEIGQTGESNSFHLALQRIGAVESFPENISALGSKQLEELVAYYLDNERQLTNKRFFVNKNLSNHLYVGLAAHLFPKARFIFLQRNPLDNCLSIYQNRIYNAAYSTSPVNIMRARVCHNEHINYWRDLYPERCFLMQYEDLVGDGEAVMRSLLEFLKLDWHDDVLKFDQRENFVRTPSVNQVRNKLNSSAVGKWVKYKGLLSEAAEVLEEFESAR